MVCGRTELPNHPGLTTKMKQKTQKPMYDRNVDPFNKAILDITLLFKFSAIYNIIIEYANIFTGIFKLF